MNKLLTIIIPTYNMEKYLRKCLDSLIVSDENMELLEVLVVNDGSKDSSSQIAHEYETRCPQTFRVIDKENGNYGSCINRGLKEATGKYVKVLDADDSFDRGVFNNYISYLQNQTCDMVITDYQTVDEKGNVKKTHTYAFPTKREFDTTIFPDKVIYTIAHQDITYKTQILKEMGYHQTEGLSYTDNEWVFMPMIYIKSIVYYPHSMYRYLRGREGQTFAIDVFKRSYSQRMKVMESMVNYYVKVYDQCSDIGKRWLDTRLIRRLAGMYYFYLIVDGTKDGNTKIVGFEAFLKDSAPSLYMKMNDVTNKWVGHYIKKWREHKHKQNILILQLLRIKNKIKPFKL